MVYFLERPELIPRVRDDEEYRGGAVEELLRVHTAVNTMWRVAARDTVLGAGALGASMLLGALRRGGKVCREAGRE
jgi:cytochrome P450